MLCQWHHHICQTTFLQAINIFSSEYVINDSLPCYKNCTKLIYFIWGNVHVDVCLCLSYIIILPLSVWKIWEIGNSIFLFTSPLQGCKHTCHTCIWFAGCCLYACGRFLALFHRIPENRSCFQRTAPAATWSGSWTGLCLTDSGTNFWFNLIWFSPVTTQHLLNLLV